MIINVSGGGNGGGGGVDIFTNKTISSWTADSTFGDFPYRGSIALTGVTASDVADVTFNPDDASSGDYAPVCQTYAGGVYVYSAQNSTSVTIPTITVFKG